MTRREPGEESGFLTELFHRFVDAHDEGRSVDREALLSEAEERGGPDGRERLRLRIRRFEDFERSATELEEDDPVPHSLGEYPVHAVIARGGMSTVYRSTDPHLERPVALKVMNTTLDADGEERALILKEARSLARMDQRGVVRVHHVGTAAGRDFLVMELLPGPSLAEVIAGLRRLREETGETSGDEASETSRLAARLEPLSARLRCLASVAEALAACHDRGLLHRDVKPANVLFDDEGEPVLIDFGLVHEVDRDEAEGLVTRQLVTTRGYSAPEQLETRQTGADPRSDQFSFAVVAYELLTLRHPFLVAGRIDLGANERAELVPPRRFEPALSRDVERILLHALERDPEHRYPDFHALSADLRAVLEHRTISIAEPSLGDVLRLFVRRRRRGLWRAGLTGLLLVTVALAMDRAASTRGRERLLERLGGIPVGAADARSIYRAGVQLEGLHAELEEWQHRDGWAWLDGGLAEPMRACVTSWWQNGRRRLQEALADGEARGLPLQHREWELVLDVADRLCAEGDCAGLAELRARGTVVLPPGAPLERVRLLQQTHLPDRGQGSTHAMVYEPIAFTEHLRPGFYRALLLAPALDEVEATFEFVIEEAWGPPLLLAFAPPRLDAFATARVEGRTCTIGYGRPGGPTPPRPGPAVQVPSYSITELLSVGEVRALCEQHAIDLDWFERLCDRLGLTDEDPAPGRQSLCFEVAHAVGGRLPSALELELAIRSGAVPPPPPGRLLGEIVADVAPGTVAKSLTVPLAVLSPEAPADTPYLSPTSNLSLDGGVQGGLYVGFHLAFSGPVEEHQARGD